MTDSYFIDGDTNAIFLDNDDGDTVIDLPNDTATAIAAALVAQAAAAVILGGGSTVVALAALATITPAANKIPYFTGPSSSSLLNFSTDGSLAGNSDSALPSEKAVKSYVDNKTNGLSWKTAVRAATTTAGTLATSFANGSAIDGVTLATGNRILIKNQATASENGIYVVNASGAPTRATDADSGAELVNATCYISEGTTLADQQWTCSTNAPITLGTTGLTFVISNSGGGTTTNSLTFNNGGAGAASGSTFDGSVARTISYNTIGATRSGAITSGDLSIATARLAGRTTAATGAVEEISVGSNLSLSAGTLNLATSPAITTPTITGGTITPAATPTATDPGFIGLPQVSKTASYTLVMGDMFKEIYITGTTAAQTITIPANGSVAAPIGAFVTITNDSNQNWSIAITTDTLALSPGGTTGTRTLAANGTATIRKVTSTRWWIYGTGLT